MPDSTPLNNADEAVNQAYRYTRFDELDGASAAAELIVIPEDNTPFLSGTIAGAQAWRVEINDVKLKLESAAAGARDRYTRQFVVLLDPQTGRLFKVTSKPIDEVPPLRPEPSAESAEEQLRDEEEIYHALPDDLPKVRLLDALDIVLSEGIGSPFLAQEINAVYVTHSQMGSGIRPVWAITLRGLPPMPARGPGGDSIPEWQRNHMRNVLDAETGEFISASNSPQPD